MARCRACGRVSVPRSPRRFAGIGRLAFALVGIFIAVVAAEAIGSIVYAGGFGTGFLRTYALLLFLTGVAALIVAGVGAAPGRVALGNQRLDRVSVLYPVQDPVIMGTLTLAGGARTAEEPGAGGILGLFGFGVALIAVGYLLSVA